MTSKPQHTMQDCQILNPPSLTRRLASKSNHLNLNSRPCSIPPRCISLDTHKPNKSYFNPSRPINLPNRRTHLRSLPPLVPRAASLDLGDLSNSRAPTHPKAMNALYFMYLCACLVERTWRFALPLCLAFVDGGYQAIAVLGFVSPLACSILGPAAGRLLDKMYRPYGLGLMVALQGVAILSSGLVVLAAAANPVASLSDGPLFIALLILSMMERLTAICSELAIERDWVTQLSGKDNALALATSNAMLRRTDLSCELVGSLAFGWLYTTVGMAGAVASATFLAALLLPAQLLSIFTVRYFFGGSYKELIITKFS